MGRKKRHQSYVPRLAQRNWEGASGIFIVRNGLSDDIQNNKVSNRYNDQTVTNQPAIVLSIQPQPDANTVEIVDAVK